MDAETKELIEALAERMCDSLKKSLISVIAGKESAPSDTNASKYKDERIEEYFSKCAEFLDLDAAVRKLCEFDALSAEVCNFETEGTLDREKWESGDTLKKAYDTMEKNFPNDIVFAALKDFPFTDLIRDLEKCKVLSRSIQEHIKDAITCCINAAALEAGSYYTSGGFICFHASDDGDEWLKLVYPLGESFNDW